MKRSVIPAALALLSACMTSAHPASFEPARGPRGVEGTIVVSGRTHSPVELLAIHDSGYVVLVGGRVGFASFPAVTRAWFRQLGPSVATDRMGVPAPDMREQLRFASRFPYGIPDQAMAALLQRGGQQAPDNLATLVPR